ncbi:MAG: ABC transporter substrate-binding protein, partial [Lachnospiraceae bacterium]|nr:ABC transporter substrate-binding protein [Lachnospiraceae bacterium]
KNEVIPGLAKEWEYDKDTCTYTFHLEEGVKWHDGKPFTAEDVKFTIEAIMNPDNGSENAPNFEDVKEIKVVDDNTVAFTLEAPNVAFLDYMTMGILPKHLLEGENMQESDYFRNPVGTGPYKLEKWEEGQAITLVKNKDYFKGEPKINKIIFKIVEDDNAKAIQMQSGELDLAQLTPKDAQNFKDKDGFTCYDMLTSDYRGIMYNFANEYWKKNKDLIPAINYAIDRQAIIDAVILGQGMIAYGPLQRNIYNNENVEQYSYDTKKAEEVLVKAGCEKKDDGFYYRDGKKVSFTCNCKVGDQVRVDIAQAASQQLAAVGIEMKVEVPSKIDWGGQEAFLIGWGSPFDADDHTYKVFGTEKGANYNSYSNEKVDKYLMEARQTEETDKRKEAYGKFQEELAKDPAYTFICYIDANYVAKSNVSGISKDTVLGHHGVGIFWNVAEWTLN